MSSTSRISGASPRARWSRLARLLPIPLWCLLTSTVLLACIDDLDQPWELAHDRVIAIRATPPSIQPGEQSQLDALLAHLDAPTTIVSPSIASVSSPLSLSDTLTHSGEEWLVTAPDAARLAAARAELGLAAGAPVPLEVSVNFPGGTLPSRKTIWLGASATNPTLEASVGNSLTEPAPPLSLPRDQDIPLSIISTPTDSVTWLTSCGTLHDFDLPSASLTIAPDDKCPSPSELVVVLRTSTGGVTWRSWMLNVE